MSATKEAAPDQKDPMTPGPLALSGPPAPSRDPAAALEPAIQGLSEDMITVLIRACVSMIGVPVDPDTLHATLRLCLRLTRAHRHAMTFAELRSTRMILGLTQSSGFSGFTPLVTLLFRHIIEDPATLRHTMEKVCPHTLLSRSRRWRVQVLKVKIQPKIFNQPAVRSDCDSEGWSK